MYGFALLLLDGTVGEGSHEGVHFFFATDIVGFVQDLLLLGFCHLGIVVHGGGVRRERQAEANGDFVEIHNDFSFHSSDKPPLPKGRWIRRRRRRRDTNPPVKNHRFLTAPFRQGGLLLYAAASNMFSMKIP